MTGSVQPDRTCIGFGEREGKCSNIADTPARLWCQECEAERRRSLTSQFAAITASFEEERNRG
jgi:hypothetical protein